MNVWHAPESIMNVSKKMMEIKHKKEGETSETHQQSILSHSLEKPGFADCKENMIQGKIPADFHFAFRCSDSFVVVIMQVQINDDFCGMDVNTPLGGSMPIEATPVLTYSGLLLTSVAATSTHDYTVAFMGTATGHLKKGDNRSEDETDRDVTNIRAGLGVGDKKSTKLGCRRVKKKWRTNAISKLTAESAMDLLRNRQLSSKGPKSKDGGGRGWS
ncbi:plexin-A4-like protein [Caerostris darwini]|uniref:Plexin-A4-like protein n=1 Tax=Caerostris darwini TaxID=1538125 RepID=A0AAV4WLS3_9ARAC|nr:plexin-A4-like protein [Caerostris darwini]